jgi:hypothetical protein
MTITELARSVQRTHSAASQKVAAMRAAGWVRTTAGTDARSKKVTLTAKASRITGRLAAEWRATEAAIAEIEAEIPYPLSQVVTDIEQALQRKSFTTGSPGNWPATLHGTQARCRDLTQARQLGQLRRTRQPPDRNSTCRFRPAEQRPLFILRSGALHDRHSTRARLTLPPGTDP